MQGLWLSTSVNTAEGLSEDTDSAQSVILPSFVTIRKQQTSTAYIMKVI